VNGASAAISHFVLRAFRSLLYVAIVDDV